MHTSRTASVSYSFTLIPSAPTSLQLEALLLYGKSFVPVTNGPELREPNRPFAVLTLSHHSHPSALLKTPSWLRLKTPHPLPHWPFLCILRLFPQTLWLSCLPWRSHRACTPHHLHAPDPPKLVFPAWPFPLRFRLIYRATCLISPLGEVLRISIGTCSEPNSWFLMFLTEPSCISSSSHLSCSSHASSSPACPVHHQVLWAPAQLHSLNIALAHVISFPHNYKGTCLSDESEHTSCLQNFYPQLLP